MFQFKSKALKSLHSIKISKLFNTYLKYFNPLKGNGKYISPLILLPNCRNYTKAWKKVNFLTLVKESVYFHINLFVNFNGNQSFKKSRNEIILPVKWGTNNQKIYVLTYIDRNTDIDIQIYIKIICCFPLTNYFFGSQCLKAIVLEMIAQGIAHTSFLQFYFCQYCIRILTYCLLNGGLFNNCKERWRLLHINIGDKIKKKLTHHVFRVVPY